MSPTHVRGVSRISCSRAANSEHSCCLTPCPGTELSQTARHMQPCSSSVLGERGHEEMKEEGKERGGREEREDGA